MARRNGITFEEITGPSRRHRVAYPRFEAIRELRARTKLSTLQIGALFGRDHTTVLHALGKLKKSEPGDVKRARRTADPVAAQ